MRIARAYRDHGHGHSIGEVRLDYAGRFLRRKVLDLVDGDRILVDLATTTSLADGGALLLEDGDEVRVTAAVEPLLEVRGASLHRLAWHIGNRHTPCQIESDRLLIQRDHVLHEMLVYLGAHLREIAGPFTPEGGAYGHGRTHSHDHGPHGATVHVPDRGGDDEN